MTSIDAALPRIKETMRSSWMAGDFGVVARTISGGAEAFVERLQVQPGLRVLDVATGTGNLALPLARAGAHVTGLDIAPNLLEQARERARAEHLIIRFDEGDAEQLPYADASFDLAVSMFGAMFAPRPDHVVRELARVIRPGGQLAMANWTPASFSGRMFAVGGRHVPPPPGVAPPVHWGDPTIVRERLGQDFTDITTHPIAVDFHLPVNPAGAVAFFRQYFGPMHMAFRSLDPHGQTVFAQALEELWASANVSEDPANETLVRNEYLEVRATRRAN